MEVNDGTSPLVNRQRNRSFIFMHITQYLLFVEKASKILKGSNSQLLSAVIHFIYENPGFAPS